MRAHIHVTLKPEVLDPQGDAVTRSLKQLGHGAVKSVRIGKFIDVDLGQIDRNTAESNVQDFCKKLLANPVMEDFRFELVES